MSPSAPKYSPARGRDVPSLGFVGRTWWGRRVADAQRLEPGPEVPSGSGRLEVHSVVDEADDYSRSVAGVQIEAARIGRGIGPNIVDAVSDIRFTATSCRIRFPMVTHTVVGDGKIIVARVMSAEPGSRWCEIDLKPGAIITYGPEAQHAAINRPGLSFTFVITDMERIESLADRMRLRIAPPARGQVHEISSSARTRSLDSAFSALATGLRRGVPMPTGLGNETLCSMVNAMTEDRRVRRIGAAKRIDSRAVVGASIDYAESIEGIPSIGELCLAAHVSERRLRQAFCDEYDMPPTRFFRLWALAEAHRRLLDSDVEAETVTHAAATAGFFHLGRFANQYKQIYGEAPSRTLRSAEPASR